MSWEEYFEYDTSPLKKGLLDVAAYVADTYFTGCTVGVILDANRWSDTGGNRFDQGSYLCTWELPFLEHSVRHAWLIKERKEDVRVDMYFAVKMGPALWHLSDTADLLTTATIRRFDVGYTYFSGNRSANG